MSTAGVVFRVLGPVEAELAGGRVRLPRRRERGLLAVLVLEAGQPVPVHRLASLLWGDQRPNDVRPALHTCVSRLRAGLAGAGGAGSGVRVVRGGADGYVIEVDRECVDAHRFTDLVASARSVADAGRRAGLLREALGLWRGPALADVEERLREVVGTRWELLRQSTLVARVEADLAVGVSEDLVGELTELTAADPLSEPLAGLLMRALSRLGYRTEALAVFRRTRSQVVEQLGIEPGRELQQLHRRILDGGEQPEPVAPPGDAAGSGPVLVPRQLPAPPTRFTGRADELVWLEQALATAEQTGPVVISAVAGTAGVGKTALATVWAHRAAERFPDGQLFLNLRGYASGPSIRPIEALTALLCSLGIPPEQIPTDEEQAAGMYRSLLAGRRVLVVLDNARAEDQVRPLIPGTSGCLVLVTSRDRLSGLVARDGARRITLDVLTPDQAGGLLAQLLGAERTRAEPQATASLAEVCAYLPLAIRIATASLADHPHQAIAEYVRELSTGDRLASLQAGGDQASAVVATFGSSYRSLPAGAARLFRLLGLVPGPDFTALVAAALLGAELARAGQLLEQLAAGHLVTEHATGRYSFHDLLRRYAGQLAGTEDGDAECAAARARLLDWYIAVTTAAADQLYPHMLRLTPAEPAAARPEFSEPAEALAWLEAERTNLVAAIGYAADHGPLQPAWRLADLLRGYFLRRRHLIDWRAVATRAAEAAERDDESPARAAARLSLGDLYLSVGRYSAAVEHYAAAAELAEQGGWQDGQAAGLGNLGIAYRDQGQLTQAAACHRRALALNQHTGRLGGQATNRVNLGILAQESGDLRESAVHFAEAVALYRRLGSRGGEGIALGNLGCAYYHLGRLDEAERCHRQALGLHRSVGDRVVEGQALAELALVLRDRGDLAGARREAEAAVDRVTGVEDRRYEAVTRNALGRVQLCLGDHRQALACFRSALRLARQTGVRLPELQALIGQASCYCRLGLPRPAAAAAQESVDRCRHSGYRLLEGEALTVLAEIRRCDGSYDDARTLAGHALERHRETGHRLGEVRTLIALAGLADTLGEPLAADQHLRTAHKLAAEIGVAVPADPLS